MVQPFVRSRVRKTSKCRAHPEAPSGESWPTRLPARPELRREHPPGRPSARARASCSRQLCRKLFPFTTEQQKGEAAMFETLCSTPCWLFIRKATIEIRNNARRCLLPISTARRGGQAPFLLVFLALLLPAFLLRVPARRPSMGPDSERLTIQVENTAACEIAKAAPTVLLLRLFLMLPCMCPLWPLAVSGVTIGTF